jgi:hypothetical protein
MAEWPRNLATTSFIYQQKQQKTTTPQVNEYNEIWGIDSPGDNG